MNLAPIIHRLAQIAQNLDAEGHVSDATALDGAIAHLSEGEAPIQSLLQGVVANLQKGGMSPQELLTHKGQDALRAELLRVLNQTKHHTSNVAPSHAP